MIKRILVAYDHGFKAQKALEIATEIAKGRNAEVYIFTSVKMPGIIDTYAARDMLKELENQSYSYFEKILEDGLSPVARGATGVGDDATAVGGVVVRLLLAALFRERLFFAMSMCS